MSRMRLILGILAMVAVGPSAIAALIPLTAERSITATAHTYHFLLEQITSSDSDAATSVTFDPFHEIVQASGEI